MKKKEVFCLSFSAIFLALAVVLDFVCKVIPFFQMPNGGGVSLSMLPIVIVAIVCGGWYAIATGLAFAIINCFLIDGYGFNIYSFIFDYVIAFSSLAIVALFRKKIIEGDKKYFILGFSIGGFLRWISSGISGVINAKIWGYDEVFLEGLFGPGNGSTLWLYFYSFIYYNLPYILVSLIISIIIGLLLLKRINKLVDF